MRPDPLRLALSERVEGKAAGQPVQPDADPFAEYRNPASGTIEETSETLTPKQQIAEMVEETLTPGEHTSDQFSKHVLNPSSSIAPP